MHPIIPASGLRPASVADEVLVVERVDGVRRGPRNHAFASFSAQMAAVGPVAERLNAAATGLLFTSEAALQAVVAPGPGAKAEIRGSGDPLVDGYWRKTGAAGAPGWARAAALEPGIDALTLLLDEQKGRIDALLAGAGADADSFAEVLVKIVAAQSRIDALLVGAPIDADSFAEVAVKLSEAIAALRGGATAAGDTLKELEDALRALAATVDLSRRTRVNPYPGKDPTSWTRQVAGPWTTAAPVIPNPGFAVGETPAGLALTITGEGAAGPIGLDHLAPGRVVDYRYGVIRLVDEARRNTFLPRLRAFGHDDEDLGPVSPPARALTVADGFKEFRLQVSTDRAKSDVELPEGTTSLRPYGGTPSDTTVGSVAIVYIERADVTEGGSGAGDLVTSPLALLGTLEATFRDPVTKNLTVATAADFKSFLEGIVIGPPTYHFPASGRFGTISVPLIGATLDGARIRKATVKNESADPNVFVAVAFGGRQAALFSPGSYTFSAGAGQTFEDLPPGQVSVVTSAASVPVTCDLWSTTNVDPNAAGRALGHLARYQSSLSQALRDAYGKAYNDLYAAGWIDLCKGSSGFIWSGRAPGNVDAPLDWANDRRFPRIGGATPPSSTNQGTTFDGTSGFDTGVIPAATPEALNVNAMLAWTDETIQNASRYVAGNSGMRLNLNRSISADGFYAASSVDVVSFRTGSAGGLKGWIRRGAAGHRLYRNKDGKIDITKTATSVGTQSLCIGGIQTSIGFTGGYIGALEFLVKTADGVAPTDPQYERLYDIFLALRTSLAGL